MSLHQTTTPKTSIIRQLSCIISCHYIKPQQRSRISCLKMCCIISCHYIKPQPMHQSKPHAYVVLYHVTTSNHNGDDDVKQLKKLYYIMSLHQTTTDALSVCVREWLYYIMSLHQTTTTKPPKEIGRAHV